MCWWAIPHQASQRWNLRGHPALSPPQVSFWGALLWLRRMYWLDPDTRDLLTLKSAQHIHGQMQLWNTITPATVWMSPSPAPVCNYSQGNENKVSPFCLTWKIQQGREQGIGLILWIGAGMGANQLTKGISVLGWLFSPRKGWVHHAVHAPGSPLLQGLFHSHCELWSGQFYLTGVL